MRKDIQNTAEIKRIEEIKKTTEIIKVNEACLDDAVIRRAGEIIRAGGLVAFPTETVYGLGADALQAQAAEKIYAAKGRPSDNPLIVHICRMEDLEKIVTQVPEQARKLAQAFWPGPLTMILNKNDCVPDRTTGGLASVAVRMPANRIALALIRSGGGFIAAPSANLSGRPSPTLAEHVWEDLQGRIPLILDGGAVGIGIESTIADLTGEIPVILRPGYITMEMLAGVIGQVRIDPGIVDEASGIKPKAPGMKYKHYAPKAEMVLVEGKPQQVVWAINRLAAAQEAEGKKAGIIAAAETADCYRHGFVVRIGDRGNEDTIAHNLYKILRELDKAGADIIYSESFSTPRIGQAIMNRMLKAAGHQVIQAESLG